MLIFPISVSSAARKDNTTYLTIGAVCINYNGFYYINDDGNIAVVGNNATVHMHGLFNTDVAEGVIYKISPEKLIIKRRTDSLFDVCSDYYNEKQIYTPYNFLSLINPFSLAEEKISHQRGSYKIIPLSNEKNSSSFFQHVSFIFDDVDENILFATFLMHDLNKISLKFQK